MTKYREILRLSSLGLSQQNIADSCNVSKKTVNRVLRRAKELDISCHLMKAIPMLYLQKSFSRLQIKSHPIRGCLTTLTFVRSCSVMESVKNSFGRNTWRIAEPMAMNHSCIHNSATTSNRMSRNIVLPCISTVNPVNRSKLTGQVILQQSLIRIPAKSSRHMYLLV